ncbi:transcriptional regulator, GntR family [Streptosporangium subroseum]|uniref:Transcriptional regulator, GntR family n=1 Tax=Streptosporangium subroseum TaxID=106412 RepID=A0A239FU81_9ACTN|nr:GntR family transcriptional regulator [Streptosporangium subroseum]SNS60557.1 transcriptional regulator, GntR family [Streptosporangium subroseum]
MEPDEVLEHPSLVELSVRRLRHEILSGALAPGERLIEEQLTQRFGISRAPLREALRSLGQQGLVEHLPRRGVRVTELSREDVDELFGLRDVLERYAVEIALPLPGAHSLTGLAQALEGMASAVRADDPLSENEAHRRFHLALVTLAGHRQLLMAYEPVILKLQLYMAANLRREAEQRAPSEGVERHRRLFDAIASGDPAIVLDALSRHGARTYIG